MELTLKDAVLNEILENSRISQNKLAKKLNTSQSNINRILKDLGYKKINGVYAFIGKESSELQFNALKYLIAICPLKLQSSVRYICRDLLSDSLPKIKQFASTVSVDEVHKDSIYNLLIECELFKFISTQVGYGYISFYFDSKEECLLFNSIIETLSNPKTSLLHYNKKKFLSELYK